MPWCRGNCDVGDSVVVDSFCIRRRQRSSLLVYVTSGFGIALANTMIEERSRKEGVSLSQRRTLFFRKEGITLARRAGTRLANARTSSSFLARAWRGSSQVPSTNTQPQELRKLVKFTFLHFFQSFTATAKFHFMTEYARI